MGRRVAAWEAYADGTLVDSFADFCERYLVLSEDRWAGLPLVLEEWQYANFAEALAVEGPDDLPVWETVVDIWPRKNGKTSLLGALSVFSIFDEGRPEILLAAPSDKGAGRLFNAAARFVRHNEELSRLLRVRDHEGEIAREDGLGIIYRLSSDPRRLHGYDPTLVIVDELAQFTTPSLERAYAALTSGGGARSRPQVYSITVAGEASERHSSILGRLLDGALEQGDVEKTPGLTIVRDHAAKRLIWNYEAPTLDPYDTKAMKLANPASWITEERLAKQAANDELTDAQVLQLHGCVWARTETTFLDPDQIEACWDKRRRLNDGERVVVGFDGSERRDETWLVACSLDGFAEPLARWARPERAPSSWRIDRGEIRDTLERAISRFDVVEVSPDPPGWYSEIDDWRASFDTDVLEFDTKQPSRFAPACERLRSEAAGGGFTFGGPLGRELARHFGQCKTRETPYGVTVQKDATDSPRKIDGAVATIVAFDRALWHAANTEEKKPTMFAWA